MTAKQYGWNSIIIDPSTVLDMNKYLELAQLTQCVAVFVVASYGDGGPTYNAESFQRWLQNNLLNFTGLKYTVFGLGNDGYQQYNAFGKYVDYRLALFGGTRIFRLGLGNAAENIEMDFNEWKAAFTETIISKKGNKGIGHLKMQFKLVPVKNVSKNALYKGEPSVQSSFSEQRPPFNKDNPFLATVSKVTELHSKLSQRSCMRIEIDLKNSRLLWKAGDHLGFYAENNYNDVVSLAKIFSVNLSRPINLENKDSDELIMKHRFPCPCTFETALLCYLDINRPPTTDMLKEFANYATDKEEFAVLQKLGSPKGRYMYCMWVINGHRNLLSILEEFPTCRPPVEVVLEMLPRLQPRHYSVSCSPKTNKSNIVINVVKVEHKVPDEPLAIASRTQRELRLKKNRVFKGIASTHLTRISNALATMDPKILIPVFIREGITSMPPNPLAAMVMIATGTGVSGFIGFMEERNALMDRGTAVGPMVLFFGCRSAKEDYIFKDFYQKMLEKKVLTKLFVSFSRDGEAKHYVQHLIKENKTLFWWYLDKKKAYVYVGGDGRRMAHCVRQTIKEVAMEFSIYNGDTYLDNLKEAGRYQQDVWTSLYEHAI